MPERDLSETLRQLMPIIQNPAFVEKISAALPAVSAKQTDMQERVEGLPFESDFIRELLGEEPAANQDTPPVLTSKQVTLASIVGIILGSPEFQRR
jgi:hypothetical protein